MGSFRTGLALVFAVASITSEVVPSHAENQRVGPGAPGRVVVQPPDEVVANPTGGFLPPNAPFPGSDDGSASWKCESPYAQCMFGFNPVGAQKEIIAELDWLRRALVDLRSKSLAIEAKIDYNLRQIEIYSQHGQNVDADFFLQVNEQLRRQRDDLAQAAIPLMDKISELIRRVQGQVGNDTLLQKTCLDGYRLCIKAVEASQQLGAFMGPRPAKK